MYISVNIQGTSKARKRAEYEERMNEFIKESNFINRINDYNIDGTDNLITLITLMTPG